MNLIEQLKRDEGVRSTMYLDSLGIPTIGVGRNIRDVGLSSEEIDFLLSNDIKIRADFLNHCSWFTDLDETRQGAILNMSFMGLEKLLGFHNMIAALIRADWPAAAAAMKDSLWARQVGARADRLEQQILTGEWQ